MDARIITDGANFALKWANGVLSGRVRLSILGHRDIWFGTLAESDNSFNLNILQSDDTHDTSCLLYLLKNKTQ